MHDTPVCLFNAMHGKSCNILAYIPIPPNSIPYAASQSHSQNERCWYHESPNENLTLRVRAEALRRTSSR
jgi:hypothetical protein